jgi:hypothetical protein
MSLGTKEMNMRPQKHQSLYDKDFNAWLHDQIHMLRTKDFAHLDIENLLEEMETLGNSNPEALESHLIIIMLHMLKQKYQPSHSSKSWNDSIINAKVQIDRILEKNPSLKNYLKNEKVFNDCYRSARRYASKETKIELRKLDEECPWTLKEILGE